jgi:phage FluMu protein Com
MQMRCYRCGMSFAVKKEEVAFALAALEEAGGNHYDAHCPRCRTANSVSIEQLRKAAPRPPDAQTEKGPISPDDDTQEPGAG